MLNPKWTTNTRLLWLSALFLLLGCVWLIPHGDFRQPGIVPRFWVGIAVMELGFILSWRLRSVPALWFWGIAILARLLLLFMYPGDDIWRYLWEGYIQTHGFSPYHLAPDAPELIPIRTDWWALMNHPDTSAIYPPIAQWGFRALATLTPAVWLFKSAFILADLAICGLLSRHFGYQRTVLYAWNPLVLYAFAGGAHYDSWFLLPLVIAWLQLDPLAPAQRAKERGADLRLSRPPGPSAVAASARSWTDGDRDVQPTNPSSPQRQQLAPWGYWASSGLLLGMSVAVKWVSLPILGFLGWRALRHRRFLPLLVLLICALLPLVLSAIPFCYDGSCPLIPVRSNFVIQARSMDLVPNITQLIWPPSRHLNWLFSIPLGLVVLGLFWNVRRFRPFAEGYFFALLVLSPVVHAWYFTWLVPFAVASRNLGVHLVSVSVFVYFVLQQRIAQGGPWELTPVETTLVWVPFLLGWAWSIWRVSDDRSNIYVGE